MFIYIYIYIYINRLNSEVCTYNELSMNPFKVYDGRKIFPTYFLSNYIRHTTLFTYLKHILKERKTEKLHAMHVKE